MGDTPIENEQPYFQRTICEIHREVYRDLVASGMSEKDPIIIKLKEAYDMGKKMNNKLRQYKYDYDEGWWKMNKLAGGTIDGNDKNHTSEFVD